MDRLSINELWSSRDEEAWSRALEVYWHFVKPELLQLEREIDSLDVETIQGMSQQQWYEFLLEKYFRWKYTAPNRYATTSKRLKSYIEESALPELSQIKQDIFSFDRNDVRQGLAVASRIRGLGTAGASGLLAILFPKYFGTVDQFAVRALREVRDLDDEKQIKRMKPESLKIDEGVILISIMRNKAGDLNREFQTGIWTARKVDMILWTYGR